MTQMQLFDNPAPELEDDPLREDDTAATSCRHCHILSTAAGIDRHEHGEDSTTCATYIARYGLVSA